jgi:hypothetical protein
MVADPGAEHILGDAWSRFQHGMSLQGSVWVNHGSHNDRHERDVTLRAGAAQGVSGGYWGGRVSALRENDARNAHSQAALKRSDKGVVLRDLGRTTGQSRQQVTPLARQVLATGGIANRYRPAAKGFACRYTVADVALLAETDDLHDTLSGPATHSRLGAAASKCRSTRSRAERASSARTVVRVALR